MCIVFDLTFRKRYEEYIRWTTLNSKACIKILRRAGGCVRETDRHCEAQFGVCRKMDDPTNRVRERDTWLSRSLRCSLTKCPHCTAFSRRYEGPRGGYWHLLTVVWRRSTFTLLHAHPQNVHPLGKDIQSIYRLTDVTPRNCPTPLISVELQLNFIPCTT